MMSCRHLSEISFFTPFVRDWVLNIPLGPFCFYSNSPKPASKNAKASFVSVHSTLSLIPSLRVFTWSSLPSKVTSKLWMRLRKPPSIPSQATPLPSFPGSTPPDSKCKDSDQPLDAGTDHTGRPQAWPHTRRLLNPLPGRPPSLPPTPPLPLPGAYPLPHSAPTSRPQGPGVSPASRGSAWSQCTEPALAAPPGPFSEGGLLFILFADIFQQLAKFLALWRHPGNIQVTDKVHENWENTPCAGPEHLLVTRK